MVFAGLLRTPVTHPTPLNTTLTMLIRLPVCSSYPPSRRDLRSPLPKADKSKWDKYQQARPPASAATPKRRALVQGHLIDAPAGRTPNM